MDASPGWKLLLDTPLLRAGDRLLAAVSGGPDSLAMLHALARAREELGFSLFAVHVHHGMRAAGESDLAQLVAQCRSWRVTLGVERVDVPALATEQRVGVEEAGRNARYAAFFRHAHAFQCTKVATAHTRDDQAETVLMNLLRGTGTEGLAGIPTRRPLCRNDPSVEVIRPLLGTSRNQVETYCAAHQLRPIHDATNDDPRYQRNRIRHELMPLLEQFQPGAKERLAYTASQVWTDAEWLRTEAATLFENVALPANDAVARLDARLLAEHPLPLVRRVLVLLLEQWGVPADQGTQSRLLCLIQHEVRAVSLPGGCLRARYEAGELLLEQITPVVDSMEVHVSVLVPGVTHAATSSLTLEIRECSPPSDPRVSSERVYLDTERIQPPLYLRVPHPGDRFHPLGAPGSRLLSDFFNDQKIPPNRRSNWPLLCDQNGILWVVGLRPDERIRVTADTTRCLHLVASRS